MAKEYPADFKKAIEFHGHACPGLAQGYRMAKAAVAALGVDEKERNELVAVAENKGCAVDAFQSVLGCTTGKGNLFINSYGNQAVTVGCRQSGKAVRIAQVPLPPSNYAEHGKVMSPSDHLVSLRENRIKEILNSSDAELFYIYPVNMMVLEKEINGGIPYSPYVPSGNGDDDSGEKLYLPLKVDPTPLINLSQSRFLYETVGIAIKSGIFKQLRTAKTVENLAEALNIDSKFTEYLLNLLTQIGCLSKCGNLFINTPLAEFYLITDSYLYLGQEFDGQPGEAFVKLFIARMQNGADERTPEPDWSQERLRQIGVISLLGSIQSTVKACDLDEASHLLDLGGGHGFYSIAFAQKYPGLKVTLFDLPHVVSLAECFIRQFAVESRVSLIGGNFMTDDIGSGYDAVLCANILHSDKRDTVLSKVRRALREGGQIILKCRIADAPDNFDNAYAKFLWQVCGGRELFSVAEWRSFLIRHEFRNVTVKDVTGIYATIVAWRK